MQDFDTKSIRSIFEAQDIETTTARFEDLLEDAEVVQLNESQFPHNKGRKRVNVDDANDLFLKTLRDEGRGNGAGVDLFCELVTATLAEELPFRFPTPRQRLVDPEGKETGLVSRLLDGKNGIAVGDHSGLANETAVKRLYAFELWVQNYDDKENHFWTIETENGRELHIVDHGHTLHRGLDYESPQEFDDLDAPTNKAGDNPGHYGVQSTDDVEGALNMISDITDKDIEGIVNRAISQIESLSVDHQEISEFLEEKDLHRECATRLLKTRRDNIRELAERRL